MDAVAGSRRLLALMVRRLTNNPFDNTGLIVVEYPCYLNGSANFLFPQFTDQVL
jgi:hypothetical protein